MIYKRSVKRSNGNAGILLDRPLTPEERAAHDEDPRSGVWARESGADLRLLTQEETDELIRSELALEASAPNERSEVQRMIGGSGAWLVNPPATKQRGGIDSDPLVRLLAYRAWGDRDRQWFETAGRADRGRGWARLIREETGRQPWNKRTVVLMCTSATGRIGSGRLLVAAGLKLAGTSRGSIRVYVINTTRNSWQAYDFLTQVPATAPRL